ncbi:MAG TPA: hypothetical protein VFF73_02605, partial [Planctomycetota bacterium]|nr:hypothetical protein [Planctomycetota bacterium]
IRSRYRGGEEQVSWNCPVRCRAISPSGLDVSARLPGDARRAIAFESELAPLGWKKRTYLKTWIEEFVKLCCVDAKLRVLSSYFLPGESPTFVETLHMVFRRFKPMVDSATPGKWLLVFGSFESSREPSVPWLPFAWETGAGPSDVALRPLTGVLRPRRIASGEDDPGAC